MSKRSTLRLDSLQPESEVDDLFQRLQRGQLSYPAGQQAPALSRTASLLAARAGWSMRDWEIKDSNGLMTLQKEQPALYQQLYTAQYGHVVTRGGTAHLTAPSAHPGLATKLSARAGWTMRDWEIKDADGLLALSKEQPALFQQLFNAQYGHVSVRR